MPLHTKRESWLGVSRHQRCPVTTLCSGVCVLHGRQSRHILCRMRRLSRRNKDLVCMRQLAQCAYCSRKLCDAFQVDHLNECRSDDREENLVATCALCHAIKSRHVRLGRNWATMKAAVREHRVWALGRWRSGVVWSDLPLWLQARLCYDDAYLYQASLRPQTGGLNLEQYRHRPGKRARRGTE